MQRNIYAALSLPPAGGPGGKGPRTVAEFIILERFKVLENESIFQKYQHFSYQKNPFFNENFRLIKQILQKFLHFSKNYFRNFKFNEAPS